MPTDCCLKSKYYILLEIYRHYVTTVTYGVVLKTLGNVLSGSPLLPTVFQGIGPQKVASFQYKKAGKKNLKRIMYKAARPMSRLLWRNPNCSRLANAIHLKQPSHLTEAKALRPRARLNLPAAFFFLFYNQIKWLIYFSALFNTVELHERERSTT